MIDTEKYQPARLNMKIVTRSLANKLHILARQADIFGQYLVVSIIGGENRRKPPTCRKSPSNFIT
jgi:hypothetical protein